MSAIERSIIGLVMRPAIRDISLGLFQPWMFTSELCRAMYEELRQPHYVSAVPQPDDFVLHLHTRHHVSPEDCELAYIVAQTVRDDPDGYVMESAVHHITEFIRDRTLARGVELIGAGARPGDAQRGREMLQSALNFSINTDQFYDFSDDQPVWTARDLDFPPGGVIIKSYFGLVNRCSLYGGMKYGDLSMIVARPGTGKSTAMVCEGAHAIDQGFPVCHIFLGDMSEYDAFLKYLSYWAGITTDQIMQDGYERYYTPDIRAKFAMLRVKALPADTFDVYAVLAKANQLRRNFLFSRLLIDYDANIKSVSGDNMYGDGGNTYANFKSYGQGKCDVIIGSQSKPVFWDHEIVPIEAPNESSKKAHHVDLMLTIGRNKSCHKLGTINIAKMRRGQSEIQSRIHLDYASTRLREITSARYDEIAAQHRAQQEGIPEDSPNPGLIIP